MELYSEDLPISLSHEPERASGFFIPDLGRSYLGNEWYGSGGENAESQPSSLWPEAISPLPPDAYSCASPFLIPSLLELKLCTIAREAYAQASPFPHAYIDKPLHSEVADSIERALEELDMEPLSSQGEAMAGARGINYSARALEGFLGWLASDGAAQFHFWLVGLQYHGICHPQILVRSVPPGELPFEECHGATARLVVFYFLTRVWHPELGGGLYFGNSRTCGPTVSVHPDFNGMFLYYPGGVFLGVNPFIGMHKAERFRVITVSYHR